jgi:hypothetical protein
VGGGDNRIMIYYNVIIILQSFMFPVIWTCSASGPSPGGRAASCLKSILFTSSLKLRDFRRKGNLSPLYKFTKWGLYIYWTSQVVSMWLIIGQALRWHSMKTTCFPFS